MLIDISNSIIYTSFYYLLVSDNHASRIIFFVNFSGLSHFPYIYNKLLFLQICMGAVENFVCFLLYFSVFEARPEEIVFSPVLH